MARKRMIDPEFWSDQEIGTNWSHSARLLYIGLWNFSDDKGRFKAHDNLLRSQIFPYEVKIDIKALKSEVGKKVQWYQVQGVEYGFVCNFLKHQRIDRPQPSKLPPPPDEFVEHSTNIRRTFDDDSLLIEEKLREVKRKTTLSGKKPEPEPLDADAQNSKAENVVTEAPGDTSYNKSKKHEPKFSEPIAYLNEKTGSKFSLTHEGNLALIRARYAEGRTLADFKTVIDRKVAQWKDDEKMSLYLRPATLFNASKFESYLNEKVAYDGIPDYFRPDNSKRR